MPTYRLRAIALSCALAAPVAASADVQLDWNLRLRHEFVDDEALARDARADTLRLRAALRTALDHGWTAMAEFEGIASAGDDYNSGANGRIGFPVIADARGGDLNQAWLGWRGKAGAITLGRQRILIDNQRFVGNVGWRQNEQTFDAVAFELAPASGVVLHYYWLGRVHRVSGDDARDPLARERELSTHLLHATLDRKGQQWSAYAYLHEDRDVAAASTATYGLRWTRPPSASSPWGISAELARQVAYANNPGSFGHEYWLLEPALLAGGTTWKLGWERLGADHGHALQTPLATLHAFNGWADKFLTTPPDGLDDVYLSASRKFGKFTWSGAIHDYRSVVDDRHYGHEANLSVAMPVRTGWNAMAKLADYRSDGFARDTVKAWLQLEYVGARP